MSESRNILSLRFNQDHECFTCTLDSGLKIFNVEPLAQLAFHDNEKVRSISQSEMLFRTNFTAVVSGDSCSQVHDNKLGLYDDVQKKIRLCICFPSSIKAVRMMKNKMIVATLNKIYVYSFPKVKQLYALHTKDNFKGLCEVTPSAKADMHILVYPGYRKGSVQFQEITGGEIGNVTTSVWIQAHKNEINCLALNQEGTLLATASQQGTNIKVWNTISKELMIELRRGSDRATIYCINFCKHSEFLCCSSDKGTVHIFALKDTDLNKRSSIPGGAISRYFDSLWSFANFQISSECASICAFGRDNSVFAIGFDGTFHKFKYTDQGYCYREDFDMFLEIHDDDEEDFI